MEPDELTFKFSTSYKTFIYLGLICSIFSIVFFVYFGLSDYEDLDLVSGIIMVSLLIMALINVVYTPVVITPKFNDTIVLTNSYIRYIHSDTDQVTISWSEITRINNNKFLGRLEIYTIDPKKKIFIEHQMNKFWDLLNQIIEHLQSRPENSFVLSGFQPTSWPKGNSGED